MKELFLEFVLVSAKYLEDFGEGLGELLDKYPIDNNNEDEYTWEIMK